MKSVYACFSALALVACAFPVNADDGKVGGGKVEGGKQVSAGKARGDGKTFGYVENVSVGNLRVEMKGKLDTGADTTSVHAHDVEIYQRSKRDNWVRFRLIGKDGRTVRYDQNVIRFVHIKTKTGGTQRRPVIHLPICVGGVSGKAEVNLADRGDFEYDVLLGREFLANRILVDSGQTFMATEVCGDKDDD